MASETRLIVLMIGALWLLWDIARTLKRIEEKVESGQDAFSDIRVATKNISKHFLPSKE